MQGDMSEFIEIFEAKSEDIVAKLQKLGFGDTEIPGTTEKIAIELARIGDVLEKILNKMGGE